jgi:hypothetical protein
VQVHPEPKRTPQKRTFESEFIKFCEDAGIEVGKKVFFEWFDYVLCLRRMGVVPV